MKKNNSKPDIFFIIFIVFCLLLGIFLANDFGESWDEWGLISLGDTIQKAYQFPFSHSRVDYSIENLRYYGPVFSLFTSILTKSIVPEANYALTLEFFHFFEYFSFIIGIISLYVIAKRYLDDWIAFAISIVFLTQPLLFGHAFINPKDIPFLGFFTAVVASGMVMADKIAIPREELAFTEVWGTAFSKRKGLLGKHKRILLFASVLLVCLVSFTVLFWDSIASLISTKVEQLFITPQNGFLVSIVERLAPKSSDIPLAAYQHKAVHQLNKAFITFSIMSGIALLFSYVRLSLWEVLGVFFRHYVSPSFKDWREQCKRLLKGKWFWILSTGALLGICTSVRVIGPAALALVMVYFYGEDRQRWLMPSLVSMVIGAFTTYFTWPFLWEAPFVNFFRSFRNMTDFNWHGNVLFNDALYPSTELPVLYLPKLLAIQLTEPVVILSILGTGLLIVNMMKRKKSQNPRTLVLLWLFLPLAYVAFSGPTMYDNSRQFLFIYPPIFILFGLGLEFIFYYLKPIWIRISLVFIVLLPGLLGILQLHPYEYIYYNSFVGGVEGAYEKYELDYWGTSLREAANFLNQNAPENSQVAVMNGSHMLQTYAREDLDIVSLTEISGSSWVDNFDYLVLFTRTNGQLYNSLGREVIFAVERHGINILTIENLN